MVIPYQLSEKQYYGIGEIAKSFNINTSLIRFWEKEFSFLKPKKNQSGNRRYMQKDIQNIAIIYDLVKIKGYTLKGAAEKIKKNKVKKKFELIQKLKFIKYELEEIKHYL